MEYIDALKKIIYGNREERYLVEINSLNRFLKGLPYSIDLHSDKGIPMDLFINSSDAKPVFSKYDFGVADDESYNNLMKLYEIQGYLLDKLDYDQVKEFLKDHPVSMNGSISNETRLHYVDEDLTKLINLTRIYKIGNVSSEFVYDICFLAEHANSEELDFLYDLLSGVFYPFGKSDYDLKVMFKINDVINFYRAYSEVTSIFIAIILSEGRELYSQKLQEYKRLSKKLNLLYYDYNLYGNVNLMDVIAAFPEEYKKCGNDLEKLKRKYKEPLNDELYILKEEISDAYCASVYLAYKLHDLVKEVEKRLNNQVTRKKN